MVSGSISLPCLGFFSPFLHSTGSLSVSRKYLALPDGAGRFTQDFSGPALLRILSGLFPYVYGTFTLYGQVFQTCSTSYTGPYNSPTTPRHKSIEVWANPRSLATTCGITIVFSSSGYLDVSVPRVTVFRHADFIGIGFPIRTSTDQRLFAPPRGLSQLITSFVVFESQGIPHTPLFAS
jgi:hypothetical protein